jgi:hypothetical protein
MFLLKELSASHSQYDLGRTLHRFRPLAVRHTSELRPSGVDISGMGYHNTLYAGP